MQTIGIYKTDVDEAILAAVISASLQYHLPGSSVSFDLDDCDKVLRIVYEPGFNQDIAREILHKFGRKMEELP